MESLLTSGREALKRHLAYFGSVSAEFFSDSIEYDPSITSLLRCVRNFLTSHHMRTATIDASTTAATNAKATKNSPATVSEVATIVAIRRPIHVVGRRLADIRV